VPACPPPHDRDAERDDRRELGLSEDRDDRRGEVEPGSVERLDEIECRAIEAVQRVDRAG
jgi:hypothetical protein